MWIKAAKELVEWLKKFDFVNNTIANALNVYVEKLNEIKKAVMTEKWEIDLKKYVINIGYGNKKYFEIEWKRYYYGYLGTTLWEEWVFSFNWKEAQKKYEYERLAD